jgi:hypothetical protein
MKLCFIAQHGCKLAYQKIIAESNLAVIYYSIFTLEKVYSSSSVTTFGVN